MAYPLSFCPGPSKIDPLIPKIAQDAFDLGIVEWNHRSHEFQNMLAACKQTIKEKLEIPYEYEIVLVSSATECWEIIAQSIIHTSSLHFYNGSFGERWLKYAQKLKPNSKGIPFGLHDEIPLDEACQNQELIAITQNETSNGTTVENNKIAELRMAAPRALIAIDATSSMGGIKLDFKNADIWYASVQKCFGLPPGLAVMILSPEAVKKAKGTANHEHYNSLSFILDNFRKNQTHHTPNILGIYLLWKVMYHREDISTIDKQTRERFDDLISFFQQGDNFKLLCANASCQSKTIIAFEAHAESIKKAALATNIRLGSGYGKWKLNTLRIANFPAHTNKDFQLLKEFVYALR